MTKLIASICLLAFVAGSSIDRIRKYRAVEAYEIRPGIFATPIYATNHVLCEIGVEKRHYLNNSVDMDATMSKEQIVSVFDELVPKGERGGSAAKLPPDTEVTEGDLGMLNTRIPYGDVTLTIFGKKDRPDRQKYVAAVVSWNKLPCDAK